MRRFLSLLHKEWRDARAVTWASAAIALGACIALNELFFHYKEAKVFAVSVLPGLVALYLAVVASDLVAADVTSGRAHTLALLPSSNRLAWTAKVAFLIIAGLGFLAWCHAAALLVHALAGRGDVAGGIALAFPDALPYHALAFGLAGAVLFFSALIQRSVASALAGLLLMGVVTAAVLSVRWQVYELQFPRGSLLIAVSVLGVLLATGAGWAYCRGPLHTAGWWRRTWLSLAIPLAVLVPAGTAGAVALDDWITLEAGDRRAVIASMSASPDGHWIALSVHRRGHQRRHIWLVSAADSSFRRVPWDSAHLEGWSDDGRLMAWTADITTPWRHREPALLRWLEPGDMRIVKSRSHDQVQAERERWGNYPLRPPVWADTFIWNTWVGKPTTYHATVSVGGKQFNEKSLSFMSFSPREPRVIFEPRPGHLVVRDILTGRDLVLGTGEGKRAATFSADGRFIAVFTDRPANRSRVIDARDGTTVAGPWADQSPSFMQGGGKAAWVRLRSRTGLRMLNLDDGTTVDLPSMTGKLACWDRHLFHAKYAAGLHDGSVAVATRCTLEIVTAAGERHRVLYLDE